MALAIYATYNGSYKYMFSAAGYLVLAIHRGFLEFTERFHGDQSCFPSPLLQGFEPLFGDTVAGSLPRFERCEEMSLGPVECGTIT